MARRINTLAVGLFALALAGCGSKKVDVTGRVMYQGRQVTFGAVFLVGTDGFARECILRADGTYLIPQVPLGEATVAVVSPNPGGATRPVAVRPPDGDDAPAAPVPAPVIPKVEGWFPIPEKYGRVSTSPLRIEVSAGTTTYDLNLD